MDAKMKEIRVFVEGLEKPFRLRVCEWKYNVTTESWLFVSDSLGDPLLTVPTDKLLAIEKIAEINSVRDR